MSTGNVKFFNHAKGFGFIKVEGTGDEIFFHISSIQEDIFDDDKVSFEIRNGNKGPMAINVKPA